VVDRHGIVDHGSSLRFREDKDSRACDPIIAVGTGLGRVRRTARYPTGVSSRSPVGLPPPSDPEPDRLRAPGCGVGAWIRLRIATSACSDSTIRRRLKTWAAQGIAERVHAAALAAYDQVIGLLLTDISTDGCITKAPCGGDKAGPSPVDRRKG